MPARRSLVRRRPDRGDAAARRSPGALLRPSRSLHAPLPADHRGATDGGPCRPLPKPRCDRALRRVVRALPLPGRGRLGARASPGDVPGAWQVAFAAAANRSVRGIGTSSLGMNAAHHPRPRLHGRRRSSAAEELHSTPTSRCSLQVIESRSVGVARGVSPGASTRASRSRSRSRSSGKRTRGGADRRRGAPRHGETASRCGTRTTPPTRAEARRTESSAVLRADAIVAATAYVPVDPERRTRATHTAPRMPAA